MIGYFLCTPDVALDTPGIGSSERAADEYDFHDLLLLHWHIPPGDGSRALVLPGLLEHAILDRLNAALLQVTKRESLHPAQSERRSLNAVLCRLVL
jgi:hypothetical protein